MDRKEDKSNTEVRRDIRYPQLSELSMIYEGFEEDISVRPPDLSLHGMFINTSTEYPQGAVLKLRFRLARTGVVIETRCEVRYCLRGVGVGVEFVAMPPESVRAIEDEIGVRAATHLAGLRDLWRRPRAQPSAFVSKSMAVFIRNQDGLDVSRLWIHHSWRGGNIAGLAAYQNEMATTPSLFPDPTREIFFDIETLRLSHEVEGGWTNIARFGLAVAVTWDAQNRFRRWFEPDAKALISELGQFDRIVSFNGDRFDFEVLSAYQPVKHLLGKSFDLLVDLHRRIGHRIKLDDLAKETLGNQKTGNGLEIVQWWREGRKEEVCKYCENDVKLLVDLVEFARRNKYVVVKSRQLRVDWP